MDDSGTHPDPIIHPLSLTTGARLGPYEITASIGAGGMGEVYRAIDVNLRRSVAIKVLPASVAADADRLARFQREAEVLAALNHPNIAAIYGLEKTADLTALVMELVEGDDLSQRLARGAIPIDEALPMAKQIAEALEVAHEQGIVHRDLKPANIKVRPDGAVKVLDFGLARAVEPAGVASPSGISLSPTITSPAVTQAGVILGTAAYMSPEQARGKVVDKRADIWAFGCVLAEMLTGHRAFAGDETLDVLAAVVSRDADLSGLPAATPAVLRRLISRCLEKDPRRRLRDMGEARIALEPATAAEPYDVPARETPQPRRWMVPTAALLGGIVGIIISTIWLAQRTSDPVAGSLMKFQVQAPAGATFESGDVSISPDGTRMVFAAQVESKRSLWLRAMSTGAVKALPGTEGGQQPFWSPDSGSLAFFAEGKLKVLEFASDQVRSVWEGVAGPGGGTWNQDGVIVFSPRLEGGLYRVPAEGGTAVPLTHLNAAKSESAHLWPHFLPDGRHYLFQLVGRPEERGIYVGELDSDGRTLLIPQPTFDLTSVAYASSGHLLFVRNHALVAQAFDAESRTLSGEPFRVADGFGIGGPGRPRFAVSTTGVLVYRPAADADMAQLEWVSRGGKDVQPIGQPGPYLGVDLSPDGNVAAVGHSTERDINIFFIDVLRGGSPSRFTSDIYAQTPRWSPHGDALAFAAIHDAPPMPVVRTLAGEEKRLARGLSSANVTSWSPDGRWVVADATDVKTLGDVWLYATDGQTPPRAILRSESNERAAAVSPVTGKLVAFMSEDRKTREVYIAAFPEPRRRQKVSTAGGTAPRWNGDGSELFFRSGDRIVVVDVPTQWDGDLPSVGAERTLFTLPPDVTAWTVTADGQRFLLNRRVAQAVEPPAEVVINWANR